MGPILAETDNLLTLYRHAVGTSRVPMILHDWCALAGIAACLEDRVYMEKLAKPLSPSLWTFLIAPSACGKGTAIEELMGYIQHTPINLFYGEVTAQALKKRMSGKPKEGQRSKAKQFLVNEEAAACIRSGSLAQDFIVHMTANYKVPRGIALRASTLTHGDMAVYDQCINWLLGSTIEWAVDAIPRDAIEGGFLGRLLPVVIDTYDPKNKGKGIRPPDYNEVSEFLVEKFQELCEVEGEMAFSLQAEELYQRWDTTREIPKDERLRATYVRMDDNVRKLSMVFTKAEDLRLKVIKERHLKLAIDAASRLMPGAVKLLHASSITDRTKDYETVLRLLRRHKGIIRHSVLLQRMAGYGVDKIGVMKALDMVKHVGKLTEHTIRTDSGRPAKGYSFRERWT